jgi:type VI secretion system protein ImpL
VADRFGIALQPQGPEAHHNQHGYFLLNLFRKVIFADKDLVAQYASPNKMRMRYAAFFAATALVGLTLGGWSWSYLGNRKLVANVEADLQQAVKLQEQRMDLQSRFNALTILQDRIEQLEQLRENRPLGLSMGLYQGELLERKLREEYFAGVREVMLKPVAQSLESFLAEVNNNAANLQSAVKAGAEVAAPTTSTLFKDASPTSAEDAYNALKTYLMLSDKPRAEGGHLNDQLTRFWRGWLDANRGAMSREDMIRNAERIISFYIAQTSDTSWPTIEAKLALVDTTRDNLRKVVKGMPARERAYGDVKARAATLFKPMTVAAIVGEQDKALILGSHAIPGAFTREALQYVQDAFREAANKELQSADWVLKTTSSDDLTLSGSPEQIQKALMDMYKADYARQWQMFVQGVSISELNGFDAAAVAMNRLGDPQISPLNKLITTVYEQTSWDNPSLVDAGMQRAKRGAAGWFKEVVLRQKPAQVNINVPANPQAAVANAALPLGPVGREFSGVARMVVASDQGASLMRGYMAQLSKLRTRFNTIKNQGDPGPGAKLLMQQTLEGKESELHEALKFVEEQMLTGMSDAQKQAIRPILVRPLMQSFAVIIKPTEVEIDKVWRAQVLQPYQKGLSAKFPFTSAANTEATNEEIGLIFGPAGAIANFFTATVGPLATRRGDEIEAKQWAGMGVTLAPQVMSSFPGWIAPLSAAGVANVEAAAPSAEPQTLFDLQAVGATGATEFTVEIDGQALRWKGQPQPWVHMVWPNAQGEAGCRITAITPDGRTVVILNEPGRFGLKRLVDTATRERIDATSFKLSWTSTGVAVALNIKMMGRRAAPQMAARPAQAGSAGFRNLKLPESIIGSKTATVATAGGAQ